MKRNNWICMATLMAAFALNAPAQVVKDKLINSFEELIPSSDFQTLSGKIEMSKVHFKDGKQSLKWSYQPNDVLTLHKDLNFEPKDSTGKDTYLSAFIVWVYNEQPVDKKIQFQFLKHGKVCTSFPMGINFQGWRGIWVCYERDMEGTPEKGMDELKILAPDTKGTLYFDHLITGTKVDARQQTADLQVPFVNKETNNHWLVIYKHSLYRPDIPLTPITSHQVEEIKKIEERFTQMLFTPEKVSASQVEKLKKQYDFYQIERDGKNITGMPIFMVRQAEAYERILPKWDKDMFTKLGMEMKAYFDLMKKIAVAYRSTDNIAMKKELKTMFLNMYDHITDQGVAYGSCWGNIHHYGYSVRNLYVSYYLMKDVLRQAGKLSDAEKTLRWYAITNEVYPRPTVDGIDIDSFNTQTQGRIASILMMEDTPEKLQYLRSFSRWIDYGCRPSDGLSGSFKSDGACFHHCNNYPAYAVGGLEGATNMIYLLSGTEFRVSPLAHQTVKNVLLTMRFYCNLKQWALSMSGRHPNGKGMLIPSQYAVLAMAGTPDGKDSLDKEMASAFLRLTHYDNQLSQDAPDYLPVTSLDKINQYRQQFIQQGIQAEDNPHGNISLGYGCVSVQRRDQWAAVIRGHSRYLWAAEHYLPANFYGRYLAHGSMQILTGKRDSMVTLASSGWQENGFDWNRIPGVTSIHLPFEQLRAKVYNVDKYSGMEEMLYSDEAFAGGLSQLHQDGNFGMKLHEHDKYNGTHRARKSYHIVDNKIVALGSGIENKNSDYPTETTVFQLCANTPASLNYWKEYQPTKNCFIDPNHVAYIVGKQSLKDMKFEKNFPQVTVGERSTKPTSGDWVSLVLNHGKAPQGAGYEYMVIPNVTDKELKTYSKHLPYKILKQNNDAHIVSFPKDKVISYVLFESDITLPTQGIVAKADTSCLIMTKELNKKEVVLTVAQPDLALYRGKSDELLDTMGKRVERSIYSRPWKDNPSLEIPMRITLRGRWNISDMSNVRLLHQDAKTTVIEVIGREGKSYDIRLRR